MGGTTTATVETSGGLVAVACGAGGFTATATGGGATATTWRTGAAPAGALATTGPAGGLVAMAGVAGGRDTMGGAGRVGGTIFRGAGLAGVAATTGSAGAVGFAAGATSFAGSFETATVRTGAWLFFDSASAACFFAKMAFITSPGLETCERSIFGATACAARDADMPALSEDRPRLKCARTLSASCSSSELECVLPVPMPSTVRTSRI